MTTAGRSHRLVIVLLDFVPRLHRNTEAFLLRATTALRERGWATLFVFAGEPAEWFVEELKGMGTQYLSTTFPLSLKECRRLSTVLRPHRPLVLHTHFLSPFDWGAHLLRFGLSAKWLFVDDHSSHPVSQKGATETLSWIRGRFFGLLLDRVIPASDFVARRDITQLHLPASKIQRIYVGGIGVDVNRYRPTAQPKNARGLCVSFAGQLTPEKGVLTLLKAYHEIRPTLADGATLNIAGGGPLEGELRDYARSRAVVGAELLGRSDSIPELFGRSDIVVVPSEWDEAFGLTAAEAMACGTAVLASDAGALPEVIGPSGEAGLLFRRGDKEDLKRKLKLLADSPDLRQRLGANARERAGSLFSSDKTIAEYVSLYDSLAL